jgi:hypothetical protein
MEQIRGAFTLTQFDEVKTRILWSPKSILADGTSALQIQAAQLQVTP